VPDEKDAELSIELDGLGERLAALRLCDPGALRAVKDSLARHGQLTAVGVFVEQGGIELLDGFKRLYAARSLGWSTLRGRVQAYDAATAKLLLAALHERHGLSEIEQAWLVRSLYRDDKLSQSEIARRLGRHKSWVCRRLSLVESLDSEVSAQVRLGLLSPRAATALAALPRGNQPAAGTLVVRFGLTVRQTERLVAELCAEADDASRKADIARRLERGPGELVASGPRRPTDAERLLADAATLRRVAARLQSSLLATPLGVHGDAAAALVQGELARLLPVLGALGVTLAAATGEATGGERAA